MENVFFTGTWTGEYTYGENYSELMGHSTSFELTMRVFNNVVTGTCVDDRNKVPLGIPASVEGFMDGSFISFVKKYPFAWETGEDGNLIKYPNEPSHEIHYTGTYDDDLFTGEWEIPVRSQLIPGGPEEEWRLKGTWSMQYFRK